MDVLGIDEAGRGSVLGPLVIAGVSIPENKCSILERIFDEVAIPVKVSDDPMTVVAKGTAIVAAEPLALEPEVRLRAMK